ncbi:hypothetical protein [Streptomyces sp. NPDC005244]|uniref:hypothetical protein n=1 Tax=Streptomyces sp. NPDC005244 TaxID=3364708 RepID=UPI0036D02359
MHTSIVSELASTTAEHGWTFLGEGFIGWRTALIAAVPAAILYELTMALTRKVTLRLPFLVLKIARLGVRKEEWDYQSREWKAELWTILGDRERNWLLRFLEGMAFGIPLAAGGARQAVKAGIRAGLPPRRSPKPKRGRHALRRTPADRTARAGLPIFVYCSFAGAGAQLTGASVGAWLFWTAVGVVAAFLILIMIIFLLDAIERRRTSRKLDHLPCDVEEILRRSAAVRTAAAAFRAPDA